MTSRLLISLSVLLIAAPKLCAQLAPAEDFFNAGAQSYISNNILAALERTEMGLKTYPNDEKLKKLEQLLKQQQQQNQQQPSQSDQQKKSDEQKQEQKQTDQKKTDKQNPPEQKKESGNKPKDEKPELPQGQPAKPGEMTPEEAKRLLDAQKGNEQLLQLKPENKTPNRQRLVRDW